MSPEFRLGVRLAVGTGRRERLRAGLIVGASALGVFVLLATLAVSHAEAVRWGQDFDMSHRLLLAVIVVFLAMPVLVLLATVNRLSASVRDRRLAALRLLGLPPGRTRLVAAVEAGTLALAGVVVGTGLFFAVRPVVGVLSLAGRRYPVVDFLPPVVQVLAVVAGVVLLAVLVSLAPTRAVTARPLATRADGPTRRPSLLRLVPSLAGAAMLGYALLRNDEASNVWEVLGPFLVGTVLTGVGLPIAVPVIVRGLADVLAQLTKRPAALIAARRLQLEPTGTTRVVAGLLIALYLVTGAQCVIVMWERTPQYIDSYHNAYIGPQQIGFMPSDKPLPPIDQLTDRPYVRQIIAAHTFQPDCEGSGSLCVTEVYLGTCAELTVLLASATGCRDDQVSWVGTKALTGENRPPAGDPLELRPARGDGVLTVEAPSTEITWDSESDYPAVFPTLFVPRDHPGAEVLLGDEHRTWVVIADPGREVWNAVYDDVLAVTGGLDFGMSMPDWEVLDQVAGYRVILWGVTSVAVFVGLIAFGIAAIDRAVERRPQVVALRALGAPNRLARRAQLLQTLVPLGLGLPLAGGLGLLAGSSYLAFDDETAYLPWASVLGLVAAAVLAAVLVALATLPAVGGRLSPEQLRRE
ncbi:FtsX-like permease family protein [Tenggerimyces flavus]|uniref:FtsX-like permease family protein n=1 Tax=Tenggerimyces flavus TaxID=1708749 RepID=A0ABV7YEI9_9ACTN|nr:FtsX-like permease family protein [Tenggerimyces flavus]MBM7786972.1 ABC-type lipoprotein release transport system permease subunit [Tenggerimyces flavus]